MRPRAIIGRVGFDTILNGQDVCIEFTRTTKLGREHDGADADGNRGMWIDVVDEDVASDHVITYYDHDDVEKPLSALSTLEALEAARLVYEWMEGHDADDEGDDEGDRGES